MLLGSNNPALKVLETFFYLKNIDLQVIKTWQVLAKDMIIPQTQEEYYDLVKYDMIGNGTHCRFIISRVFFSPATLGH